MIIGRYPINKDEKTLQVYIGKMCTYTKGLENENKYIRC